MISGAGRQSEKSAFSTASSSAPACLVNAAPALSHAEPEVVEFTGSGANEWVAGDDEEMQQFVPIEDVFKGRHFDRQIIVLCVRWYTSYKLSLRDLVIMMADLGISVTHTTIRRWVQHYLPEFEKSYILRFTDSGCTCTAPSTKRVRRSISI
jgi:hypothetical protein